MTPRTVLFVLLGGQSINADRDGGVCMPLFMNPVNNHFSIVLHMTKCARILEDRKVMIGGGSLVTMHGSDPAKLFASWAWG